ncbi:hypothetical protein [Photobacterium leiognathi]|uniref:Uncharacterized protein n=2 Tax=Photobacterium leiognathi TaxID=553611 RepID=A0A2T3KZC9_PHOLD|nr:hypothetical protein [Photobacterium leiognathi]PSV13474.1 hypothetical protein C0W93_00585 [Photobacterium leiognathi subsp. mandapamensis]
MFEIIERFHDQLLDNYEFTSVCVEEIFYDDILKELFEEANPISGLRGCNIENGDTANLFNLAALQSPIICYRYRNHFRVVAGVFTLNMIRKGIAQRHVHSDYKVPVFILSKKPIGLVRKHIIQFDLTNMLLTKCFISDTKKISFFLHAWFEKDQGKRSIYQSKEWLSLFPNLDTTEKVSNFLSISKKSL